MSEHHFEPASDHATWRGLAHTAGEGVRAIRNSRVLVMIAVAIFLAGGASEVYDRYNEKYLLVDIGPPAWPGWSGLTWMAVIGCMSAALGVVVPWWFQRRHGRLDEPAQRRWIVWLVVVQVAGLLTMAATGSFVVAAAATLLIDRVRSLRSGLLGAWIVPLTPQAQPGDGAVDVGADRLDRPGDAEPRPRRDRPGCRHLGGAGRERGAPRPVGRSPSDVQG